MLIFGFLCVISCNCVTFHDSEYLGLIEHSIMKIWIQKQNSCTMSGFTSARSNREGLRRPRMAYKGSEIIGGDGIWASNFNCEF